MRIAIVLLVIVHTMSYAQEIHPYQEGVDLLSQLVKEYKPIAALKSYASTRDTMYRHVYRDDNGYVRCYYTGHTIYLPQDVDPSSYLWDNDNPNGITAEHIYPQSKGAKYGNAKVDLHSLVPAISRANEARSNYPYGDIEDNETDHWYLLTDDLIVIPEDKLDAYSEKLNGGWGNLGKFEPREAVKGDIARAVFYFYTMYKDEADSADESYFGSMKEDLLSWHINDPVDKREYELNKKKAPYQEGKINPFIEDCTLVSRAYFSALSDLDCTTDYVSDIEKSDDNTKFDIFPNPVIDFLNIESNVVQLLDLSITDSSGQLVKKISFPKSNQIDLTNFDRGLYFVTLRTNTTLQSLKFIKN